MCYVFKSLIENRLLRRGDTIALGTPIFTPYLEMPHLERLRVQDRRDRPERDGSDGRHTWQYPDEEIAKLADPRDQGVLPRQSRQPGVVRHAARHAAADRRAGADEAARPDHPDRRRLRHVLPRLPLAGRRSAAQHDPRLLVLEALRLHRLAPGRRRAARGQHLDETLAALPAADRAALHERYESLTTDARNS